MDRIHFLQFLLLKEALRKNKSCGNYTIILLVVKTMFAVTMKIVIKNCL